MNLERKAKVKFGILFKLILGFLIPVAFIVLLGIISYKKASEGLVTNYEQSTDNTIAMATSYLNYVSRIGGCITHYSMWMIRHSLFYQGTSIYRYTEADSLCDEYQQRALT